MSNHGNLRIRLDDIKVATNNFSDNNRIGQGGFGNVYKGELVHGGEYVTVAVKRLDPKYGQGAREFHQEIKVLSSYRHTNLVSLVGFSDEDGENILVYKYLPNESLDKHLSSSKLSWVDRLSICIGAARGLEHLHTENRSHFSVSVSIHFSSIFSSQMHTPDLDNPHKHRAVLHRDIKSGNVLLDTNWNAKISDLGLSAFPKHGLPFDMSGPVGTTGYCDPGLNRNTGIYYKESDIYSFGVVLFEVLCGRLAPMNNGRQLLSELAKSCYEQNKIGTIVLESLKDQISPCCLKKFAKLAYQCLREDHTKRPSVAEIVNKLKAIHLCQIKCDFSKERRLHSHTLFQLINNQTMRTLLEKEWSDKKVRFLQHVSS